MKRTITIIALIAFIAGCASMQTISPEMREVVTIEEHNFSQDEAYERLMRWVAQTYNSANDVVQLDDKEAGTIIVKGAVDVTRSMMMVSYPASYTTTIDVRDQRVRFTQRVGGSLNPEISDPLAGEAKQVHVYFEVLRADAMRALREEDTF